MNDSSIIDQYKQVAVLCTQKYYQHVRIRFSSREEKRKAEMNFQQPNVVRQIKEDEENTSKL